MSEFRTVTREEFFATINPLNVHPRAEPEYSIWEMQDGSRRVMGKTMPGYKNGWTREGQAPRVYMLKV